MTRDSAVDDGFFPFSVVRHGTLTGYDRHRERGQSICADCRRVRARYDERYRRSRKLRERARLRAFRRLARRHAAEFTRLFDDELRLVRDQVAAETDAVLSVLADADVEDGDAEDAS